MYLHLDGLRLRKFSIDHSSTTLMSSCTNLKSLQKDIGLYSETSNNGLSERRTTSVQWANSMPQIALPIEIVHLEPLSSGHLSTPDNGQPGCPPKDSNLYKITSKSGRRPKPQA